MDGKPFEPKKGWDVGERPTVPMPYFRLPEHKFVEAHLRRAPPGALELRRPPECRDLEFSSKTPHAAQVEMHARRDYQRRPGEGWLSKLHPKTLDYRTVDELGMHPDDLALDRKPAEEFPTLRIVETVFHGDEQAQGRAKPARPLESGKKAYGSVEQFSYQYFKVTAPFKNMTVTVHVTAVSGDPDIFVCNRNANPTSSHHTWRSAGTGDDEVVIKPDDPMFYPGAFYIGIYGIVDSHFEITASYVRHRAQVQHQAQMMGSGYADVRGELRLADTRRVFCRHGTGFMEQLQSRVAHHSSNPPQHLSADWPWPASRVLLCTSSPSCSHP